ncbi:MFS domain-containing protein [Fusarium keratoplasticum]|uniref:MFS domain-containing protein n=1 Tax=Fusarium keratoplasticum TaxID=1328300 RepID=A0ACC0QHI5_9HYPO|nr:MFS domain-containing protein [Fusarium keratoplasticum]KAI8654850.1 MFS domain-containing protein [Fusarium keratoplasticum]
MDSSVSQPRGFFKNYRVYILATVSYMGSLLFGYDVGVMGGLLPFESFRRDFGIPTGSSGFADGRVAEISSNVVSLLTAGCFFGALSAAIANDRYGRRYSLMAYSVIFLLGAALQTGAPNDLSYLYAGRVIAGLGVGGMSSITPVFVAETAPADVRGRVTGLFQEFLVLGSTIAYWLNYGIERGMPVSSAQWRIPLGVQMIPAVFLFIGLIPLKESPRWLVEKGREDQALASLAYIRNMPVDSHEVSREFVEIKTSLDEEEGKMREAVWKECLKPGVRNRFALIFGLMLCQQLTGTNSIGYYAPQIFQTVGLSGADASLFATGIYGIVKLIFTAISLLFVIDKIGRRWAHVGGGAWMSAMMFILASVLATHPPKEGEGVSSASIAMCVLIYLYVIAYTGSWGPGPWIYAGEIFPTHVRSYGVAFGAATQWLFNFMVTRVTPQIIHDIGWKTFLVFASLCFGMSVFTFFFMKETKGLTLEEIDQLFGLSDMEQFHNDVERRMTKLEGLDPVMTTATVEEEKGGAKQEEAK